MVFLVREKAYDPFCDERTKKGFNMDPRNEDYYAETPSEKARRELEEHKQVTKEAIKEALEEHYGSGGTRVSITFEDLMKILNKQ